MNNLYVKSTSDVEMDDDGERFITHGIEIFNGPLMGGDLVAEFEVRESFNGYRENTYRTDANAYTTETVCEGSSFHFEDEALEDMTKWGFTEQDVEKFIFLSA